MPLRHAGKKKVWALLLGLAKSTYYAFTFLQWLTVFYSLSGTCYNQPATILLCIYTFKRIHKKAFQSLYISNKIFCEGACPWPREKALKLSAIYSLTYLEPCVYLHKFGITIHLSLGVGKLLKPVELLLSECLTPLFEDCCTQVGWLCRRGTCEKKFQIMVVYLIWFISFLGKLLCHSLVENRLLSFGSFSCYEGWLK